ncbi:RhuM family protein [Nitrobacter sp. TKz-YC01]|uniref:RhuM family protein n=1 Tax=Nitrobacter sp. TKz-YC01 TaxID=3398703 RepID=UPI003A103378
MAIVSKNYLAEGEIKELNRLTTILLDIFEDQLDIGKLVVMDDARRLLDDQLRNLNRRVLAHGGHIKMSDAKKHAERQYDKFNAARKLERQREADRFIAELKTTDKALPKSRR